LREISSIDEIRKIVEDFSGLLKKITNKERENLSLDIEALKREEIKLGNYTEIWRKIMIR